MSEIRIKIGKNHTKKLLNWLKNFDETQRIGDAIGGVNGVIVPNELWENVFCVIAVMIL